MKGVLYPDRFLRSGLAPAHGPLRVKDSLDARPEAAHVADEDHPPRDLSVEAGAMRRECDVDRSGGSPHSAQRRGARQRTRPSTRATPRCQEERLLPAGPGSARQAGPHGRQRTKQGNVTRDHASTPSPDRSDFECPRWRTK